MSRQEEEVVIMWYRMQRWVVLRFDSCLQDMHIGEVHPTWHWGGGRKEVRHITFDADHFSLG